MCEHAGPGTEEETSTATKFSRFVIPECFYRESSVVKAQDAGSPIILRLTLRMVSDSRTTNFGDDGLGTGLFVGGDFGFKLECEADIIQAVDQAVFAEFVHIKMNHAS